MGWKYTSDTFQISAVASESAPNTLGTTTINLNLDSLSREIIVIERVDLDLSTPDLVAGVRTQMNCSLNDIAGIGVGGLSNSSVIATANQTVIADAAAGMAVSFTNQEPQYAQMAETPLFVSATDDLFLAVQGVGNVVATGLAQARIYARRAKADADTYAAILTSQFN